MQTVERKHLVNPMPASVHEALGIPLKPMNPRQSKIAAGLHRMHGLDGQKDKTVPVNLQIPCGLTVDDLLDEIARRTKPQIDQLNRLLYTVSPRLERLRVPRVMPYGPGWWQWNGKKWIATDAPNNIVAVVDFETTWTNDDTEWFPVCLVAIDDKASIVVWLADGTKDQLEPLLDFGAGSMLVGHNVSYDRSFIKAEYAKERTATRFWDTMSAFIAVRGITNQQRAALLKNQKEQVFVGEWADETTTNGLDAVYEFYGLGKLDKGVRQQLVDNGWAWVRRNLDKVLMYCIQDVIATIRVFNHVYPEWLLSQPSPVNRWAQIELGSVWVPLSKDRWPNYAATCDRLVGEIEAKAGSFLRDRVQKVIETYKPACMELVSALKPVRADVIARSKSLDFETGKERKAWVELEFEHKAEPYLDRFCEDLPVNLASLDWTPALSGATKGLPKWYRGIKGEYGVRKRWAPLVLELQWNGKPVYWDVEAVPFYHNDQGKPGDRAGFATEEGPIPHPEKRGKRVTSLFAKGFVDASENGTLSAPDPEVKDMLREYISTTLWSSMQSRIHGLKIHSLEGFPVCIPRMAVTGTISRRCADSVWQVLANPKAKRIGSELKSLIEVPSDEYVFLGADVEAQEAWLAALIGDALATGVNGSTGFAYSIYIGSKEAKTDFHSLNMIFAGLDNRDQAKPLGFGCLYGAGVKGNADYLQKVQPKLTRSEAENTATVFVGKFKGERDRYGSYCGGLASEAFNAMAAVANSHNPVTPVLKAALTRALANSRDFATSRNNWVIQSSGADFRDCLVAFGAYFFELLGVDGRLILTIHDEIRYMVRKSDTRKAAYALQLAHIYTRALFVREMGMDCLPASVAWFPLIDVDTVIRKEVFLTCVTPSQTEPIAPGYSLKPSDLTEYIVSSWHRR
jgi:DNA polymerase gamma 1